MAISFPQPNFPALCVDAKHVSPTCVIVVEVSLIWLCSRSFRNFCLVCFLQVFQAFRVSTRSNVLVKVFNWFFFLVMQSTKTSYVVFVV